MKKRKVVSILVVLVLLVGIINFSSAISNDQQVVDDFADSITGNNITVYSNEALPYTITKPEAAEITTEWTGITTTATGGIFQINGGVAQVVNRPEWSLGGTVTATYTLQITKGTGSTTKEFYVKVRPEFQSLHQVVLEALSWDAQKRSDFVEDVFIPLNSTTDEAAVTQALIDTAKGYLQDPDAITDLRLEEALKKYVVLTTSQKNRVCMELESGLPGSLNSTIGFDGIASEINGEITGDPTDLRGLKLIVKLFAPVVSITGRAIVEDGTGSSIQFNIPSGYEDQINDIANPFLDAVGVLVDLIDDNDPSTDRFTELVTFIEEKVNARLVNHPDEVAAFKVFLAKNNGIYDIMYGDVDGNGAINATDMLYMKLKILGRISDFPSPIGYAAADVDGNGAINATDMLYMKLKILGRISDFPVDSN